jgi:hypothetical protein
MRDRSRTAKPRCPTCGNPSRVWEPDARLRAGGLWRCRTCRSNAQARWRARQPGRIDGLTRSQWRRLIGWARFDAPASVQAPSVQRRIQALQDDDDLPLETLAALGRLLDAHRWTALHRFLRSTPRPGVDRRAVGPGASPGGRGQVDRSPTAAGIAVDHFVRSLQSIEEETRR